MTAGVLLTVGNSMMGDDAAGPLLASLLARAPARDWHVVDGGSMPENEVHHLRALQPQRVLLVDAAEMDLSPGEIRLVDEDLIAGQPFLTTHRLPLTFLLRALRDFVPIVQLLAIQPRLVAFSYPMSEEVRRAVELIHQSLTTGADVERYGRLEV